MEGRRRGVVRVAVLLAVGVLVAGGVGCGEDAGGGDSLTAVRTGDPERAFAPLIEVPADEPWRPMSTRWFIERSVFRFAEDEGCDDRRIAVGHTLPEQWTPEIDWIFPKGLGGWSWRAYYRNPYDADCDYDLDKVFHADQLTRPHDPGRRADGLRPGEGFYLDLVDEARPGPAWPDGATIAQPVYSERTDEGDSQVRLTYWTLYGMDGEPGRPDAHEGDWQRVDVLLRDLGDDRYEPVGVQSVEPVGPSSAGADSHRDFPWAAVRRVDGTHPVVRIARATHEPTAVAPGDGARCSDCLRWEAWSLLTDARKERWYGFGGAWGETGRTSATTGPLGPHGFFPTVSDKAREIAG